MRNQFHNLPSQGDTADQDDAGNSKMISTHYVCQESVWQTILSPDQESVIPFCFYQYPFFQIPAEQFPSTPCFFLPPITSNGLNSLDTVSHYDDELIDLGFTTESQACNAPYGDGLIPGDYTSYSENIIYENVKNVSEVPSTYPIVTNYGTVTILLRHLVRVDILPSKAVYVTNLPATCVAVMNGAGNKCCIIHPNGRVLYDGKDIHMATLNKKAKICRRGIIFTSTDHCLSYLVDASGTKTTAEKFRNLNKDFSVDIFYDNAVSSNSIEECYHMVNASEYKSYWNGDEVWFLGGFRIKQNERGDVKVTRNDGHHVIQSSPTTGQVSIKTFRAEISINRYHNNYFVVRKGNKQVTASLRVFNVKNGTQKARFNRLGKLALF